MSTQPKSGRAIAAVIAIAVAVAILMSASTARAAGASVPKIELSTTRVVVTGITPRGEAIIFGGAQEVGVAVNLIRWQRELTDDDGDGSVTLDLERDLPGDSVWVAVDLRTGGVATAAPVESRFRQVAFPAEVLPKGGEGKVEHYVTGRRMADVLIVRPRVGAWVAFAADGRSGDADQRHDGRTTITFAAARSVKARVPAPRHLTPRDVFVAIDVRGLQYYLTEVGE